MIITYEHLQELGACEKHLDLFEQAFGSSLELPTELKAQQELALLLEEWRFDRSFPRQKILTPEQRSCYLAVTEPLVENFINIIDVQWQIYLHTQHTEEDPYLRHARKIYDTIYSKEMEKCEVACWLIMIQILTNTLEQK